MGQKVHPNGQRVGIVRDWVTRWFTNKKNFANYLVDDFKIREYLKEKLYAAGISKIEIERVVGKVTFNIFAAKPGIIIGRGGAGIDTLKKDIAGRMVGNAVSLNIVEVKNPDMDAQLVAENIAAQLEKRVSFRRAVKMSIGRTMKNGAKGIKAMVGGRLGGAEIARSEAYHEGSIPLQTLRADIDYGFAEAHCSYGRIGVKVWIYKNQILPRAKKVVANPVVEKIEGGDK